MHFFVIGSNVDVCVLLTWAPLATVSPEGGGGGGAPGSPGVRGALPTGGEHALLPSCGEAGGGRRCSGAVGGAVAPALGGGGGGAPGPPGVGGAQGRSREHALLPPCGQTAWKMTVDKKLERGIQIYLDQNRWRGGRREGGGDWLSSSTGLSVLRLCIFDSLFVRSLIKTIFFLFKVQLSLVKFNFEV